MQCHWSSRVTQCHWWSRVYNQHVIVPLKKQDPRYRPRPQTRGTKNIYVYPSARRNTGSIILAMKHFTGPADKVGIFYSDNAPELVSAMKILQWRHTISKDYISKSNAVAERLVRSILEGTRVNLLQSGLHHQYWPHAARHWCFMCNVVQIGDEITPWKLRFGEDYKGPKIPFGCQIDYWTGPRKRPKSDLKFEPTSKPGIFLGYVVHPGFDFRTEFIVASLQDMRVANFEDKVNVLRVIKVSEPEVINFPFTRSTGIESETAVVKHPLRSSMTYFRKKHRMQSPCGSRSRPMKLSRKLGENLPIHFLRTQGREQSTTQDGLHSWTIVDGKEGWYEFAECWVEIENYTETFCDPGAKLNKESFPFRTTCCKYDDEWYVMEENLKIDPPTEELQKGIDDVLVVDTLVSIFSKEPIDLCQSRDVPAPSGGEKEGDDLIEVINVKREKRKEYQRLIQDTIVQMVSKPAL